MFIQSKTYMTNGIDGETGFYKDGIIMNTGNITYIVSTDHDIRTRRLQISIPELTGKATVQHGTGKMSQYDDQVSTGTAYLRDQFPQHIGRGIHEKAFKGFDHVGSISSCQTDDTDADSLPLQHDPGFREGKQFAGIFSSDVGTKNGEFCLGKHLTHGIKAIVKLMVTQSHGIKAEGVANLHHRCAVSQIADGRGAENVTGIQNQRAVRIFGADLLIKTRNFGGTGTVIGLINGAGKIGLCNNI